MANTISHCWACAVVSRTKVAMLTNRPTTRTALAPKRFEKRPESMPKMNMKTVDGRRINPECVMLAPNP